MALPVFDPDVHHVGLGDSPSTLKGLVLSGGSRAMLQNAPQITEFGSSRNLVDAPSLNRWTQDDFLGGAFWPTWHPNDPAVFSHCKNFIGSQQGRSLRSVPPRYLWDDETGGTSPGGYRNVASTGDYLLSLWANRLVRTKLSDKSRTEYDAAGSGTNVTFWNLRVQPMSSYGYPVLWITAVPAGGNFGGLLRKRLDTWAAGTTYRNVPIGTGPFCVALEFGGVIPVSWWTDGKVYTITENATETTDPVFTSIGRLHGYWYDSVAYNGLVYIAAYDTLVGVSRVITTDGSALSTLIELPYNFVVQKITSYAGSIWVSGYGSDITGEGIYGVLHQITGNTSRLVKTFSPENQIGGGDHPWFLQAMSVHEGILWMGGGGNYLVAYDITTDALYGASEYSHGSSGTKDIMQLVSGKGELFAFGKNPSDAAVTGWHRLANSGDGVSAFSPELTTADFDPEPALDKRWSQVHLLSRYDNNAPTIEYSLNGGTSWTTATVVSTTSGTFTKTVADLSAAAVSRQIRLRFKFPRGSNVTNFVELVSFTLTFSFLDSGKRSWILPVLGVERPELEDGSYAVYDLSVLESQLWTWIQSQTQLTFVDLDGGQRKVQLVNLQKQFPDVGPQVDGTTREGFYSLTLVEI